MKCEKAQVRLTELILDELDIEQRREVEVHLRDCRSCTALREEMAGTLGMLKEVPPVVSSSDRRDRTVQALVEEHRRRTEAVFLVRRTLPWFRLSAAAVVLIALSGVLFPFWRAQGAEGDSLEVTAVVGRARFSRAEGGGYRELAPQIRLEAGDRIFTEPGSRVELAVLRNGAVTGKLEIVEDSSFLLRSSEGASGRMVLERGALRIEMQGEPALATLSTPYGDEVRFGKGRYDIALRETTHVSVQGWREVKPEPVAGADLAFVERPLAEVCRAVGGATGRDIEPLFEKAVTFYASSTDADLLARFQEQMKGQGLVVREQEGKLLVLSAQYRVKETSRRLLTRVSEGEARLAGSRGEIVLSTREQGEVGTEGIPTARPFDPAEKFSWRRSSSDEDPRVLLPGLRLLSAGRDAEGNPVLECVVEPGESAAEIEGVRVVVAPDPEFSGREASRILRPGADGQAELEFKIRVKFEKKK